MAENGINSPLDDEIQTQIDDGSACELLTGRSLSPSPGVVELDFKMDPDCPLVTFVTMIAPSPDWFVGANSLNLNANGEWIEQRVVELFPYDAGTDSGKTYTSPNEPISSPEAIHRIETEPFLVDGTVPPLGTFTLTQLKETMMEYNDMGEESTHADHMEEDVEDTSIATMEEVTAWIDHFVIRREKINIGDKASIHVHVRRRDKLGEIWNGKIMVGFGDQKIERNIPLNNAGDDHFDYLFDSFKSGNFTVKVQIYDEIGILDSSEGQIIVAGS
jgi:hypothetical protein